MSEDKATKLLSRIRSIASKDEFQQVRLEIEEQAIVFQTDALAKMRTEWFRHGIIQFKTEFVDVIVAESAKGIHIPIILTEGPETLVMTWEDMDRYLRPEYLGLEGYNAMITIVAETISQLLEAVQGRTEVRATWLQRLLTLVPTVAAELPDPEQPTAA